MSNPRNTAIKRIQADVRELTRHPSRRYFAEPLEDNMFEWHFTIRGPSGSDFQEGLYHGRILLPADYPFKPPNIIFLTKNGRFEVGTKICLSISAHHPEAWQPAWGVRTMLEAIISFLPTEGNGAIGALDWSSEERKRLAIESHEYACAHCGPIKLLIVERGDVEEPPDAEIAAQVSQLRMYNIPPISEVSRRFSFDESKSPTLPLPTALQLSPSVTLPGQSSEAHMEEGDELSASPFMEPDQPVENVFSDGTDLFDALETADNLYVTRMREGGGLLERILTITQYTSGFLVLLLIVRRIFQYLPFQLGGGEL